MSAPGMLSAALSGMSTEHSHSYLHAHLRHNYSAPAGSGVLRSVCLSVCLSVRWIDLHEIVCADPLWPWLGPPLAALRYVMYTSGVMDDVTYGRNGRDAERWVAALSDGDQ